jgi:2-iminobutanoate/2-iminopropanoate deaminase
MSAPVGPYAPAVRAGQWLVCSGQLGTHPGSEGPELVTGGFEEQARRALANVAGLLAGRRLGWANVVKTTVFLSDMANYAVFNNVYLEAIGKHRPARSVVAVAALPMGALVEIEAWAYAAETFTPS